MESDAKLKKQSSLARLFEYAGNYKYLTILSWIFSVVSAWIALVPFYYIWRVIKEILDVAPHYENAGNLANYGWHGSRFCNSIHVSLHLRTALSHLSAFHVQAGDTFTADAPYQTLPMGFMDSDGSGKIRKIVNESSEATETYLAHQLPDQAGAIATPVGLLVLLPDV